MTPASPSTATRVVQAVLGTTAVSSAWRWGTRNRLRVLTYHGIGDAARFEAQVQHLSRHYSPVGSAQVVRWLHTGQSLPPRAVWVTFDDGVEDVVRLGLPLLRQHRVPATLFVCPGLIDTDRLHWWQAVERAGASGLLAAPTSTVLRELKAATDVARRRAIDDIESSLRGVPAGAAGSQLTTLDLRAWLQAGNDLGNHSLDHPRLDRCSADEQVRQVVAAHGWLADLLGVAPTLFAWPNGDPAAAASAALIELGYRVVAVCDHRLTGAEGDPMKLSRLRIDADAPLARFRSVVSGAHPAVFAGQQRLRALTRRSA